MSRDFGFRTRKPPRNFGVKSGLSQKRLKYGKKYFIWWYVSRYPFIPTNPLLFYLFIDGLKKIGPAVRRHKHNYTLITPKNTQSFKQDRIQSFVLALPVGFMVQARYSGASSQNDYCMDRTKSHLILLAQITTRCTS